MDDGGGALRLRRGCGVGLAVGHVRQRHLSGGVERGVSFRIRGRPMREDGAGGGKGERERSCEKREGVRNGSVEEIR